VLEKVSDMITDEDAVVRKEFRALSKQLLRGAEPAAVAPHLRMFLAHVCGGMSHVHASIRASALALLDDIVPLFPRAAALLGHKLLPIFLHILGGGENIGGMAGGATAATGAAAWAKMSGSSRGPKLKTMALDERLAILRNLHALLRAIAGVCFAHTHAAAVAARGADAAERGGKAGAAGAGGVGHSRKAKARASRQVGCHIEWQESTPTRLLPGHGARGTAFLDGGAGGGEGGVLARGTRAGGPSVGGEGDEVEQVLTEFLLDALPLLVQAWAEAYQCATDASMIGGGAESHGVAVQTLGELVEVLELAMAALVELGKRASSSGGSADGNSALARQQQQAAGVCRAVIQHFPLDPERLRAASDHQVRVINAGILHVVTAGLRACRGLAAGGVFAGGATGPKLEKLHMEMQRMEEQLCAFVGNELWHAQAAMAAAGGGARAGRSQGKKEGKADKKELERAAVAASEGAAGMIEALSVVIVAREERGVGGCWDGSDAQLLETFTSCWQASKSSSLCKKARTLARNPTL